MPCNSDYLEAHTRERELSRVQCLLDELDGKPIHHNWWKGYHPAVYSKTITKETADDMVATLCSRLRNTDVTRYSLEMQTWWRDHQAADAARVASENAARGSSFVDALRTTKVPPSERHVWTQDPQNSDYIHISSGWRVYQLGTERWEVRARLKEYNWYAVWVFTSPHKAIRFVELVSNTFMQNSRAMHRAAHDAQLQVERELP